MARSADSRSDLAVERAVEASVAASADTLVADANYCSHSATIMFASDATRHLRLSFSDYFTLSTRALVSSKALRYQINSGSDQ